MRCPLTFNHRTFLTQLDLLSPQSTVLGGSLLGDAIRLAAESLDAEGTGKAIVVLSDGEDMESSPLEAAANAATERGIRLYTVGIGDKSEGARIPVRSGGRTEFLIHEGEQVWTRLDPTVLAGVAREGNGAYLEAGTAQADMAQLARILSTGIGARERERADVSTRIPLFPWLAGLAAFLLALEPLVPNRRLSREIAA
jgi:Ca-activated chloride channel family protein